MPLGQSSNIKKRKGHYHCPFPRCVYNSRGKSFSEKKSLDQHIGKMHAEKKYICQGCGKGFGLDWWRKHHEKTCGIDWICDCGSKYTSRESLLTHVRRTGHDFTDPVLPSSQVKKQKPSSETKETPTIILIQPIIQNVICDPKLLFNPVLSPRPILPKGIHPHTFPQTSTSKSLNSFESSSSMSSSSKPQTSGLMNESSLSYDSKQMNVDELFMNLNNSNKPTLKAVATQTLSECIKSAGILGSEISIKPTQMSISTQTPNKFENHLKMRESRASQCSRRKSKTSGSVVNESTCTQTAESAVVKIKRKRSRRKSVAITTEPSLLILDKQNREHSMWPDFKDLIIQNPVESGSLSYRNTMSTQTSYNCNKILCDSQTITDEEFFKYDLAETIKKDYESSICKETYGIAANLPVDPLSTLQDSNFCSTLPEFDLFSANTVATKEKLTESSSDYARTSSDAVLRNETCPIFNMFDDCQKSDESGKISHPGLTDIHTQTMANSEFDFNLLANMETQTTDEFALYDFLEFSDTETQTPWEDFPEIDKSPLPPDQLSIEIQTDFSSLSSELNADPYAFFNNTYVQHMIDVCSDKGRVGVNCETQTHNFFSCPQLTNSESQTLDTSHQTL